MLFSDRLEVWNPGTLPPSLTLEKLRHPHGSVPGNPLLAEPLYLTKYIERMGTGTGDMIRRCREAGLDEPEFALTDGFVTTLRRKPDLAFKAVGGEVATAVTGQVTGHVAAKVLRFCERPRFGTEIQSLVGIKHRETFLKNYLNPMIAQGWLARTIPAKPRSRFQQYHSTPEGRAWLAAQSH